MQPRTPALSALLGVIGVVFVAEFWLTTYPGNVDLGLRMDIPDRATWALGSLTPGGVLKRGEWWRLFTSLFLHGELFPHFLFNCVALLQLGRLVETVFGGWKLVLVFFLSGLGSDAASIFRLAAQDHWASGSVGASGAVCGLLGLLIAHLKGKEDAASQFYRQQLVRWAVFIAVFSLLPRIDWAGHLGGFLVGYGLGFVLPTAHFAHMKAGWRRSWHRIAAGVLCFAALVAFVFAGLGALKREGTMRDGNRIFEGARTLANAVDKKQAAEDLSLSIPALAPPTNLHQAHQQLLRAMEQAGAENPLAEISALEAMNSCVEAMEAHRPGLFVIPKGR